MNNANALMDPRVPQKQLIVARIGFYRGNICAEKKRCEEGRSAGRATSQFSSKRTATIWSNPFAPFARQNLRAVAHRTLLDFGKNPFVSAARATICSHKPRQPRQARQA